MSWDRWMIRAALVGTVAGAAIASFMVPQRAAQAATLTVTKTLDTNDGTCDADCSLREAINTAASGDTVSVPAGTYTLTIAGANEDLGATGDLDVAVNLAIDGAGSATTIIDGNELDRVLDVASGIDLSLQGLTVRDGDPGFGERGGGIRAESGTLTIDDVTVSLNDTTGQGGGIYAGVSLVITNSSVTTNAGFAGGGIVTPNLDMSDTNMEDNVSVDQGGGIWWCCSDATFTITDSTIDDNEAGDQGGGIFHCCGALQLTLTGTSVSGNSAQEDGGGIFFCCGDEVEPTLIVISDSTISDNTSTGQGGGLFSCCENGPPIDIVITDTTISGNEADSDGGGIYDCCGAGTTTITDSVISDNRAGDAGFLGTSGGGIYSDADHLTIINSTISGNAAFGDGGGVYSDSLDAVIDASTISGNSATTDEDGGGGIYNGGTMRLQNSTVSGHTTNGGGGGIYNGSEMEVVHATIAGNSAGGPGDQIFGAISLYNSIVAGSADNCAGEDGPLIDSWGINIDSGASCTLDDPSDMSNTDPLLGPIANNGGPTQTRALLAGSPAIDAADGEWCPGADQRGVARPVGSECDIGAFEGESEGGPTPTATATRTMTPTRTSVPDEEGGDDTFGGAPNLRFTSTPEPTTAPPSPTAPAPATATVAPGGGVAPGGIGAPNTGAGPGDGRSQLWLIIVGLASLAGIAAATGMAAAIRRGR